METSTGCQQRTNGVEAVQRAAKQSQSANSGRWTHTAANRVIAAKQKLRADCPADVAISGVLMPERNRHCDSTRLSEGHVIA